MRPIWHQYLTVGAILRWRATTPSGFPEPGRLRRVWLRIRYGRNWIQYHELIEARKLVEKFRQAYPAIQEWHMEVAEQGKSIIASANLAQPYCHAGYESMECLGCVSRERCEYLNPTIAKEK